VNPHTRVMPTSNGRYPRARLAPPSIVHKAIPEGVAGTRRTVEHIGTLIRAGAADFYVRQHAIDVLLASRVAPKDYLGEVRALFAWVQKNVRYTRDPFRIEVLHSARRMLELRAGDCDDMSVVLGAMLEAVGHPVRLVLTGPDSTRPDLFSHVYVEVFHQGDWIPLDATMPHAAGWEPRTPVRTVIPIERTATMAPQTAGAPKEPWIGTLVRDVGAGSLGRGDRRVRALAERLAAGGVLRRSRWTAAVLRYLWDRGLPARSHPRTADRLARVLRRTGLLPAPVQQPPGVGSANPPPPPAAAAALRPVAVRPVGSVRPAPLRALTPLVPRGRMERMNGTEVA
jgi:hypothetical protein